MFNAVLAVEQAHYNNSTGNRWKRVKHLYFFFRKNIIYTVLYNKSVTHRWWVARFHCLDSQHVANKCLRETRTKLTCCVLNRNYISTWNQYHLGPPGIMNLNLEVFTWPSAKLRQCKPSIIVSHRKHNNFLKIFNITAHSIMTTLNNIYIPRRILKHGQVNVNNY